MNDIIWIHMNWLLSSENKFDFFGSLNAMDAADFTTIQFKTDRTCKWYLFTYS